MKFVIQRVKNASVEIDGKIFSSIDKGLLVFFCAEKEDEKGGEYGGKKLDSDSVLDYFANKILKLRIFEDNDGKMNRSVFDIGGKILVVSQFTLAANCKKGTRPSFDSAMEPVLAKKMYEDFVEKLQRAAKTLLKEELTKATQIQENATEEILCGCGLKSVHTGVFGADMKVFLINDGPVTILM